MVFSYISIFNNSSNTNHTLDKKQQQKLNSLDINSINPQSIHFIQKNISPSSTYNKFDFNNSIFIQKYISIDNYSLSDYINLNHSIFDIYTQYISQLTTLLCKSVDKDRCKYFNKNSFYNSHNQLIQTYIFPINDLIKNLILDIAYIKLHNFIIQHYSNKYFISNFHINIHFIDNISQNINFNYYIDDNWDQLLSVFCDPSQNEFQFIQRKNHKKNILTIANITISGLLHY
tara:strand:+ start:120 stop:812 length:693 start_codon:yes stop_codon:yes gene_type:complete